MKLRATLQTDTELTTVYRIKQLTWFCEKDFCISYKIETVEKIWMNRNNISSRLSGGHLDAVLLNSVSINAILTQERFPSELGLNCHACI